MRIQKQQWPSVARCGLATAALAAALGAASIEVTFSAAQVVRAGDSLQAAIDRAQPGDEIRLQAGATFTGSFVLRAREGGDRAITIRTDTPDSRLPSAGQRIGPQHARLLPTLAASSAGPVFRTEPGARQWRLLGLRIVGNGGSDLITLGDGSTAQRAYAQVPEQLELDRVLILGDPTRGQKRGIALNSGATTIRNSYIADIKAVGQETQAIAGWNGPGPYLIENNYLEAAGISVLFGGAEPSIGGLVPSDITIRRNVMAKPVEWRTQDWTVKNLFELKNARRVLIEGNLLERNWAAAQSGYAILFTVRASGPRSEWSTVESVIFQNNLVRQVAGGINILGFDTAAPSQQARAIMIRNNLFYDVDRAAWGGNGAFMLIGDEPADVTVERNTILQSGNLITAYGGTRINPRPIHAFRFRDNIARHNEFGVFGDGIGVGLPGLAAYFPGVEFTGNVLAGGQENRYPPGNRFPTVSELMSQFVNPSAGNFRLRPGSWARTLAADGGAVGADLDQIFQAMGGVGLR
jgi:hypothetical protein